MRYQNLEQFLNTNVHVRLKNACTAKLLSVLLLVEKITGTNNHYAYAANFESSQFSFEVILWAVDGQTKKTKN